MCSLAVLVRQHVEGGKGGRGVLLVRGVSVWRRREGKGEGERV